MTEQLKALQRAVKGLGYDPGPIDGEWGPLTEAATLAVVKAKGEPKALAQGVKVAGDLPWMKIVKTVLGLHETKNKAVLAKFLKSDGSTVGDPEQFAWCGDGVETPIKLALPKEPFTGKLKQNAYWARNWAEFGIALRPTYGAVLVFERPGGKGHVGFAVGEDDLNYYVLGGNQSNQFCIAPIAKTRLLASRWPATWPAPNPPPKLPRMKLAGGKVSTNEA